MQSAENFGQSIAKAGWYEHKGRMRIWGRSDMDASGVWQVGKGEEEEIEVSCILHLRCMRDPKVTLILFRCRTW